MTSEPSAPKNGALMFPPGFAWGATVAAYSVEGDNAASDWWRWEQRPGRVAGDAPSRHASRHFQHALDDVQRAAKFGHNVISISIEWARVAPTADTVDAEALQHYRDVVSAARREGLNPVVTLVHYSLPQWFSERGGWRHGAAADAFERYAVAIADALAGDVSHWIPMAHPAHWVWQSYVEGVWPPGGRNPLHARQARNTVFGAYAAAVRALKNHDAGAQVGLSLHVPSVVPHDPQRESDARLAQWLRRQFRDVPRREITGCDFIALSPGPWRPVRFSPTHIRSVFTQWMPANGEDDHAAFRDLLDQARTWGIPILVHGDGLATSDDTQRQRFLMERLRIVHEAMGQGAPITGYLVRSLLDGYEWERGFEARYGLFHVDRASGVRTPNPSAFLFKDICEANGLTPGAMSRYGRTATKARR